MDPTISTGNCTIHGLTSLKNLITNSRYRIVSKSKNKNMENFDSVITDREGTRDVHGVGFRIENFRILQNFPVSDPVLGC